MSYNTRRGSGNFNKALSSSQVGQRRSQNPNNYGQNLPSQNRGNQQNDNYGYFTQQHGSRQQPPRHPSAQQQMAKEQQMLVQKKQLQAQQQKQVQQKQQMAQQKQQEDLELKRKKELEEQKQRDLELQKQKSLEAQKQRELELQKQKQKELELQKQKELELQKQKELALQKQKELELQKQKEVELQRVKEIELQKLKELELAQLKQLELMKVKHEQDLQTKKEMELQKEREVQESSAAVRMEVDQQQGVPNLDDAPAPPAISEEGVENVGSKPMRRRFPQRNRKISKYEIQKRRNQRLSKLLQPKSAMVILNEVGKNVTYNVERSQNRSGPKGYMFKATVVVDETTHEGYGLSKASAKNEAAEKALKFLVKQKKLVQALSTEPTNLQEGEEAMDTSEKLEKPMELPLAWQQFASFAIYKLLDSWGEDLEMIKEEVKVEKKPAKKLPPNAELINPLMLMNQMLPRVNFIELPRTSNGHLSIFNFKAEVDGKTFTGSGVCKKIAKRLAAFAICNEILGIQYPPEIYTPTYERAPTLAC